MKSCNATELLPLINYIKYKLGIYFREKKDGGKYEKLNYLINYIKYKLGNLDLKNKPNLLLKRLKTDLPNQCFNC